MKTLKDRRVAWIVLVVCVLISVVFLGGGGLRSARGRAVSVFMDGVDPSDTSGGVKLSCDQYLKESAEYATLMAEECRRYVSLESATAQSVLELSETVKAGGDPNPRVAAYRQLAGKVESLYTEFQASGLSEEQTKVFDKNYTNFTQDAAPKIEKDGYKDAAAKFNGELEGTLGGLLGIKPLELF